MKPCIRLGILALVPGLALLGTAVRGQAPTLSPEGKVFTKKMVFKLPLQIEEKDRGNLREVQLYVKNGPREPWSCKESMPPTQSYFTYRVQEDGEYWFSVVMVDKNGKMTPADVSKEPPGLMVVVDTVAPEVEMHPFTAVSGEAYVQCDVHDAHADWSKVLVEYQSADGAWLVLGTVPDQRGLYKLPDAKFMGMVRATVADKAGNTTRREINLSRTPALAASSAAPYPAPTASRPDRATVPTSSGPANATVQLIQSNHVSLSYQIDQQGPTGVGKVEVWVTRDEGKTWQRLCEDADRKSPVEFDLPGDALYGITLVVSTGNGTGATPPAKGDQPDYWIEVDATKPVAQLLAVRPSNGTDPDTYLITWTASDKNLKPEPIDLYYATRADGPWQPMAKGLKNNGNYRWSVPKGLGTQVFVHMEVTDRAGNVAKCDAPQPVVLDQAKPKARVIGIVGGDPRLTPPNAH